MKLSEKNLYNYQTHAVEFIETNTHAGLFMEMGTGKSVSTLTAINRLMNEDFEINNVLIIAPKRVAEVVWSDEISRWGHLRNLTISKVLGNERQRVTALKVKASIHIISRDNIAWLVDPIVRPRA